MNQEELRTMARLSARLAANNARVLSSAERLSDRVDALVAALRRADWSEIRRISENAAAGASGTDTIRYRAERVCEELLKPNNLHAIRQSVVRLIGACGTTRYEKQHHEKQPADKSAEWSI
jgi:hypothetical protein